MYTYEQRMAAVNLYIKYYYKAAAVIRELGYPNRHVCEFQSNGVPVPEERCAHSNANGVAVPF